MSKVTMPEPFLMVADQPWGGHAEVIRGARGGEGVIDCYTADQMEAYAAAKVREALEAAYSIAFRENFGGKRAGDRSWAECARGIAERIRDLILPKQ